MCNGYGNQSQCFDFMRVASEAVKTALKRDIEMGHKELRIVRGAAHLFEKPGTIVEVAHLVVPFGSECR